MGASLLEFLQFSSMGPAYSASFGTAPLRTPFTSSRAWLQRRVNGNLFGKVEQSFGLICGLLGWHVVAVQVAVNAGVWKSLRVFLLVR